eukprot:m.326698 g.326698  ORF g.326698 m.326698 type:complete len:56 (+) comp16560_c2_seq29:391-558(+)
MGCLQSKEEDFVAMKTGFGEKMESEANAVKEDENEGKKIEASGVMIQVCAEDEDG